MPGLIWRTSAVAAVAGRAVRVQVVRAGPIHQAIALVGAVVGQVPLHDVAVPAAVDPFDSLVVLVVGRVGVGGVGGLQPARGVDGL